MDFMNFKNAKLSEDSDEALMYLIYDADAPDEGDVLHPVFRYDDIKENWSDFDPDEIEGVTIDFQDEYAIANVCVAQGQGNYIIVWDIENDEPVHMTRCAYAEKSVIDGCWIYTLCDVGCYGVKQHLSITKTKFEEIDMFNEGEILDFRLEPEYDSRYDGNDFFIRIDGDEVEAGYRNFSGKCKK